MGAATTMLEAGAEARFGRFGHDRFDAYVALSPQGVGIFWTETSWQAVRKPVLMITGTRDRGADGDYTTRLEAFRRLPAGAAHRLAIFEDVNHLQLSGRSAALGDQLAKLIDDFVAGRPSALPGITIMSSR
jgi:pimeloyl-ACP methyl ester carboxylesterase